MLETTDAVTIVFNGHSSFLIQLRSLKAKKHHSTSDISRSIHSKTAATRPLPTERALKTDLLSTLPTSLPHYSDTTG